MVKCGVLFEVRTEFLNIIYTSFGFKGLNNINQLIFVMVKCGVLLEVRTGFFIKITPCCRATKLVNLSNYFNIQ
jgi:hypothetical protein